MPKKPRKHHPRSTNVIPIKEELEDKTEVAAKEGKTHFQANCKLGLNHPDELTGFCPHGLERARWFTDNPSSSAAEELTARGCPYAVLSEDEDGYCFFKMMLNKDGKAFTEEEIAKRLGLNLSQVRTILSRALLKIRNTKFYEEICELRRTGELYDNAIEEEDIYFPSGFGGGGGFTTEDTGEATEEGGNAKRRRTPVSKSVVASPDFS